MSATKTVFQINNLTEGGLIPPVFLRRIKILINRFKKVSGAEVKELSLVFVTRTVIRKLNAQYRRHDKVTDVLSFTYQIKPIVGELFICLNQASKQAQRRHHSLNQEISLLFVHGLLHLAGYDHMKPKDRLVMRGLEKKILF